MRALIALTAVSLCAGSMQAEIIDSIGAVVAGQAIKHSDVLREIRITALQNHEPVSLTAQMQQEATSRLIDQAIIRDEIREGLYAPTDDESARALLDQLKTSYGGPEAFQGALSSHQLDEETVRQHLEWQTAVLRFIELRFGEDATAQGNNDALFQWLDLKREEKRVVIKKERLQ